MTRRVRTPGSLAVAVVGLAILAAACGGGRASGEGVATAGGSAKGKEVSARTQTDPQQAGLDFARCMREHGVEVADPTPGQGGFAVRIDRAGPGGPGGGAAPPSGGAVAAEIVSGSDSEAFQACKHHLDRAVGSSDVTIDPEMQDRALKFAKCMREHGVDMPDPQFSGGAVSIMIGGNLDPSSPTLQAAQEACSQFFGPPGAGGEGGGFVLSGRAGRS